MESPSMDPSEPYSESSGETSSQSASEGASSLDQGDVQEWLANDLVSQEVFPIERLLRAFVIRCKDTDSTPPTQFPSGSTKTEKASTTLPTSPGAPSQPDSTLAATDSDSSDDALFERCLEAARLICNLPQMRSLLTEYCKSNGHEKARYPLFVKAFNYALEKLSDVKVTGLLPASELGILFHRNDPTRITGKHGRYSTSRVPDIVIVSQAAAIRASRLDKGSWEQGASAPTQPKDQFSWLEVLATLELKKDKRVLSDPPQEYKTSPLQPIPTNLLRGTTGLTLDFIPPTTSSVHPMSDTDTQNLDSQPKPTTVSCSVTEHAKRKAPGEPEEAREDDASRATPKKARLEVAEDSNKKVQSAMVQSASYGTEMLCSSISRCHSIGLAIRDEIVWVWWYDRQGAIQSHGIDIIRNLPHFLVLLLTFQRFNLEQWGFNTKLNPGVERIHRDATETAKETSYSLSFPGDIEVTLDPQEKIYQQYSLAGKSTRVLGAASRSPHPRSSSSLANTKLVAKSYWPNVLRLSEGVILTHAVEKAGSTDHLPDLICSSDGYLTKSIRDELGLESPKGTCRVFRIAIFERLDPITKLQGEAFLKAWLECIKCHYTLWNGGIQHRDLSLSNLMLRTKGDQLFGVINDWDLSFVEEHSPVLREHAATIPFLSIDLLRKEYWDGDINVLYRHDLESFVWVLVWVLHCYDRGSICIPPSLMQWQTADYGLCTTFKVKFLSQYHKYRQYTVRTGWTTEAPIVRRLISWLNGIQNQEPVVDEPEVDEPEAMLTEFTGQLREASKAGGLEYMSQLISDCLVDGSK